MTSSIWYISKYIALPSAERGGTRGFLLMREMVRRGHRGLMIASDANHLTDVPTLDRPHMIEHVDGVEVCWVRTRKFRGARSIGRILSWLDFEWRLWRLPKRGFHPPDAVIISSLSLLTILNGLLLRRRFGCRLIFEVRDIWPLTLVEEGGFSPRNPFVLLLGLVERLGYRRADAIVGTMPNLAQHVDEQVARHAPVHTIPFGVDDATVANVRPVPDEWIDRHMPRGKFVICYAGTIGITNALDPLFACARLMADRPDIHFLIVGEGDLKDRYQAAQVDLRNVTFTGPVPKTMVRSILERCDILYFSAMRSRIWTYGMSLNKAIDYMLAARPVIGSYTGYRTMIEEAGAGTVVPAGDPVALRTEILRYHAMSRATRDGIGAHGRTWLLRHRDYAVLADDYLRIALPDREAA